MSTNVGDELLATDLINWYNTLNTTINVGGNQGAWKTSGGTVITSITVPSSASLKGTDIYASQIYEITDRINKLLTDEYITTQSGLYSSYNSALYSTTATVTYAVRAGCIIYTNALTPFVTTINNWKTSIKCRNLATYSKGSYSSGSNSHGQRQYSNYTCGTNQCGTQNNGSKKYTNCISGTNGNTACGSGTMSNVTKSCTTCSSGVYGSTGMQNLTRNYGSNLHGKYNHFNYSCGSNSHGNLANGSNTCGKYSSTCGSGSCSSGSHSSGKYGNTPYSCGRYSSGTKKDILCACETYIHGS